ncbi:MAG: hypothetical protein M0P69_16610 [Bacteroidales bacterium]|nr:hypothetical protein [Bacteroidales bacterium]
MNSDDIIPGIQVRYKWRTYEGTGIIREKVPGDRVAVKCDDCSLIVLVDVKDVSPLATENLPPLNKKAKA